MAAMAAREVVSTTEQYRELQDKLEELTTCPICRERYKQPKILSCHHTFCCNCLQSYFTQTPGTSSPCPLCRSPFYPPDGNVSNLPTSTFMQDVVMMIDRKSPITKRNCMVCQKSNNDAGYVCVECDLQMCGSCRNIHDMFRTDSHNLLQLDEIQNVPIISVIAGKNTSRACEKHKGQILEYLCLSCNIPMCSECKTTSHYQHRAQNINHAAEETRNIIRVIQKSSNPEINRLTEFITEIKSLSTSMQISTDAMKDEVRTMTDSLIKVLREKEKKLLHDIETDAMLRQKELKTIEDATELRLTSELSFLDYVKSLQTFGNVTQLSVAKETIQKRMENNRGQGIPILPESCQCDRKFKVSDTFQNILRAKDLGSIETFKPVMQRTPPPIPPRVNQTHTNFEPPMFTSPAKLNPKVPPSRDPKPEVTLSDETLVKQPVESDNEYTNPKEFLWRDVDTDGSTSPPTSPTKYKQNDTGKHPTTNRPLPPPPNPHPHRASMSMAGSEYLRVSPETPQQRLRRAMSDSQLLDETSVKPVLPHPKLTCSQVSFNAKVKISGLAITRNDDVIVVSNKSKKCMVFNQFGNLKNNISDRLVSPWDVAVGVINDELKDAVYITDTGERSGEGDVKEYRLNGTYVRTLVNKLQKPHGITYSQCSDVIYVCDAEDRSVIALPLARGKKAQKIHQNMLGKNMFICPWYVSVTPGGEIIVSDFDAKKVVGVNKETGRKKKSYKPVRSRNSPGFKPAMSCVDSDSNIFVIDQSSSSIYVWASSQDPKMISIPPNIDIRQPVALAFDSLGALWIGSRNGALIKVHFNL